MNVLTLIFLSIRFPTLYFVGIKGYSIAIRICPHVRRWFVVLQFDMQFYLRRIKACVTVNIWLVVCY